MSEPAGSDGVVPDAPPADRGYVVTEQIGHLIRKTHQRHTAIFQQLSCDKQLTPQQFATLCVAYDHGPCSQTELVRMTAIDQATIRGVINRLHRRGLVAFQSDTRDQRKVIRQMTAEGRRLIERMLPCARQITEKTLERLNETERVALTLLLKKMNG